MSWWAVWVVWGLIAFGLAGYLYVNLTGPDATLFLPGQTTAGHYQIELQCSACHGTKEDGTVGEVKQSACLECHAEELERIGDSHPIAKFAKPKDSLMLEPFDGTFNAKMVKTDFCVTCHVEHDPAVTRPMGLTQPEDYCIACHETIYEDRVTHVGLGYTTCLTAGCHNFHDNSALYEAYLTEHRDDPDYKPESEALRPLRDYSERYAAEQAGRGKPVVALTRATMDKPASVEVSEEHLVAWETTAHARAGINCTDCHNQPDASGKMAWVERPSYVSCQECHEDQTHGFLKSRHGMRLNAGLDTMRPEMARLDMKPSAHGQEMKCNACHGGHEFDVSFAATDACMSCHDDPHTRNYTNSLHYELWVDELAGKGPAGSGVSCATCHLPRVVEREGGRESVHVMHNQNDFLRPNEKMVRNVCTSCHGVPFALDALADEDLITRNFDAPPKKPHFEPSSFDLIEQKLERLREEGRLDD